MTNKWVWIPHFERVWIQAQVISVLFNEHNPETTSECLVDHPDTPGVFRKVSLSDCHKVDPTHIIDLDNICFMNDMHEAPLLDLLRRRFFNQKIYTYAGDVLISINPYESIPSIYDDPLQYFSLVGASSLEEAVIGEHQNTLPHVFQIANRALCSLAKEHLLRPSAAVISEGLNDECLNDKVLHKAYNNQSIIISGESGSGKTENSKHVLSFLIAVNNLLCDTMEKQNPSNSPIPGDYADHIRRVLLLSSCLLEAFGNAKTLRNDNSSRFGKYIKLLYVPHRKVKGGKVFPKLLSAQTETFLLEKSRLSAIGDNERSYHIFYQILSGLNDSQLRAKLHLDVDIEHFKILQCSSSGCIASSTTANDSIDFSNTMNALRELQCSEEEILQVITLIAAVLHLGNFVLNDGDNAAEGGGSDIVQLDCKTIPIEVLAQLLGLEVSTFKMSLTMQQLVIARRSSLKVKILSSAEVENNLSALLKLIYSNLFDWIVRKINCCHGSNGDNYVQPSEPDVHFHPNVSFIGILDIFGFEILSVNSFEQLCINFANERLQQQFNQHVFIKEQELYLSEGLEWSNISYRDNQQVIDTIAGTKKPNLGLLLLIEELGMLNRKPDDIALISTFNQIHDSVNNILSGTNSKLIQSAPIYSKSKLGKEYFSIRHFAGDVNYYVEGFLAKNNDTIQQDLIKLLATSKNEFLRNVMKFPGSLEGQLGYIPSHSLTISTSSTTPSNDTSHPPASGGKKLAATTSVSSQFRNQLDSLMNLLTSTSPHYIKCLKPNALKRCTTFDSILVNEQLKYSGVMEVVRIRREGFPLRLSFFDFYRDYAILAKGKSKEEFPDPMLCSFEQAKKCCEELISTCLERENYKIGHSLIFLRDNGKQMMIDAIKNFFHRKVAKVQALYRMRGQRLWYLAVLQCITSLQAVVRGYVKKRRYETMKSAGNYIKRFLLYSLQRLSFCRIYEQVLEVKRMQAVALLQRVVRGHLGRLVFRQKYAVYLNGLQQAAVKIQAGFRGHRKRLWYKDAKLHIAATTIQCMVRKRIAYNRISEISYATFVIQSFCRMCVARFYAAKAMRAIICIQSTVRQYLDRKRFLLQRKCAIRIQSSFRMFSSFRFVLLQFAAVWCLQSVVRMWLVRRRFLYARKAAITIQKYLRRQLALELFMRKYVAVINCQRFARGFITRLKYKISYVSILMIQTFFRMSLCRLRFLRIRNAISRIKARYRTKVISAEYLVTVNCIVMVQSVVRRHLGMVRKRRALAAILALQSFGRMINQKRKFDEMALAAITIQTCMRRKLYRNRFLFYRAKVVTVQALFRRTHARIYKSKALRAIIVLQSFGRMINRKREYDEVYVDIVTVQGMWRRKLAVMRYRRVRFKLIKIQSWMRMNLAMSSYFYHLAAVIAVQSFARRVLAVNRLRCSQLAVICIQAYFRRYFVSKHYRSLLSACSIVQPTIRMFLSRNKYKKILRAQTTIAKCFRGHRDFVKYCWTIRALVKIQRFLKRSLSRMHFKSRINQLFNINSSFPAVAVQQDPTLTSPASSPSPLISSIDSFMDHIRNHPEDRYIRFAANDFCTLFQSLVFAKQSILLKKLEVQVSEAFDVDKFARNAAHYVGMYPSLDCLRIFFDAINSFKFHHTSNAVMAALDDDDEENDNDDNDANENIKQLKQALNMSVGNSTLKQGWLKKKRGGWNWQKRYFVLTEDYIIYYKNPQSINNPKFAIPLEGCTVQRSTGLNKDPIIELTSPNMGEKKKLFGGSKNNKMISFLAENEKELQEWLMPLKAVSGVETLRASPPVNYIHTELCQLWVAAVDKNLETPLHLLVRYHCIRKPKNEQSFTEDNSGIKKVETGKNPVRRVSVIQRIKQSIVASKSVDHEETSANKVLRKENFNKKFASDDQYKLWDRDVDFSLEETIEVLTWFVEFGCPINGQNYMGDTALHLALQGRAHPKLLRALLLKGADPKSFKNDSGIAPFDLIGTNPEMRALYLDVFSNSTKNIGVLFKTSPERSYLASSKLKGYSYLSILLGYQTFESSK